MKPTQNTVPVFALDPATTWDDLNNDMEAVVRYQQTERGKILPLFCFAPMTEPANPDVWEPMKTLPENLLVVSIERHIDAKILKALELARAAVGEVVQASPDSPVGINYELPLSDIYEQMSDAGVSACSSVHPDKDDPSFFFLRGSDTVIAFDEELRNVTQPKP
ncbi:MAG: hypothetical protein NT105_01470 [Verrucomicrobia bacterium]|nr:hypothetical protein [Verrucomicrobiota bacterium]